ncbi:acyltransferase [Konateibacter massiliensis]|uniref:acyltransferase n=1 Tax=Konateibacter massiliensis TaxID=2002841 RepID=UPI00117A9B77|nr:acyltransferase [Konateibacter massiliensis]
MDFIIELIRNKYSGRDIVLWGAGNGCSFYKKAIETNIGVIKYVVDVNPDKQNKTSVFNPSVLDGRAKEVFVVVTCTSYFAEIEQKLRYYGYNEESDYLYFPNEVRNYHGKLYCDINGNKIVGDLGGAIVKFNGQNSTLVIEESVVLNNITLIIGENCKIQIGEGTRINPGNIGQITRWKILDGGELCIGKNCTFFGGGQLFVIENSRLEVGDGTTVGYDYYFYSPLNSYLIIGKDCMLSHRVGLHAQDGHAIFDLKSMKKINNHNGTLIHDHVWIGYNATILKNVTVGTGAIIGADSHVNKSVPNNCVVSGNPAVVIKTDVAWTRRGGAKQLEMLDAQYKKFTENEGD